MTRHPEHRRPRGAGLLLALLATALGFMADLCTGRVTAIGRGGRRLLTRKSGRTVSSFGEDTAGRIYLVDISGSVVAVKLTGDPTPDRPITGAAIGSGNGYSARYTA